MWTFNFSFNLNFSANNVDGICVYATDCTNGNCKSGVCTGTL